MNVTRLVFYGVLAYAAAIGDIPWWILPAWILYDNRLFILFKVPFTKIPLEPPFNWKDYKGPEDHETN